MESSWNYGTILYIVVMLFFYYYFTLTFDFWKLRGVCGPSPIPFFGNIRDIMFARKSMADFLTEIYENYKNEFVIGIFARRTPILIVKDPDLIQDMLIKDFSKFRDRGLTTHKKTEPLLQHLFLLEYEKWRPLRTRLIPIFTSSKLKQMFSLILECSRQLERYLEKLTKKNEPVECRGLMAKFTIDVIANCAFGIDTNVLSNENSEFLKMATELFKPTWDKVLRSRIKHASPWFYDILGYILPQTQFTKFFTRTIMSNIDYREKHNIIRHDFIDMLRELKRCPDKLGFELTDSLIAAQAFVFFAAGFETSSSTISHALYELAQNQVVQDTLRKEIDQEYTKCGENLTYDNIKGMSYMDKVFKETLRIYPPITHLIRQSILNYTFNGIKVNIPKGQTIWIPLYSIHRDPRIYPEPNVFDPERFNKEVMESRHSMFYLPFGEGPRNCIGARFATFQIKIGLIKILRNYKVEICEQTQIPYRNDPKTFVLTPKHGIVLRLIKINRT